MRNRLRLLMAATALLYLGPLLAGLSGQVWAAVPVFVLIFLLWSIVMRPQSFPRAAAAWAEPRIWIGALTQLAVQALLVLLLFGLGRGIGGVAGFLPLLHPLLPAAVSALSVPLSRLVWDPERAAKIDALLDDALAQIGGTSPAEDARRKAELDAEVDRVRARIEAGETDLERLAEDVPAWQMFQAISDLKIAGPLRPALRAGLIDFATSPARSMELQGQEAPTFAFMMIEADAGDCARFAARYAALLQADAEAWWDGPSNRLLRVAERRHAGTPAAAGLHDLRRAQLCMARDRRDRARAEALAEAAE